eukprot:11172779-Lingulodinium_polyedra.AAC.1
MWAAQPSRSEIDIDCCKDSPSASRGRLNRRGPDGQRRRFSSQKGRPDGWRGPTVRVRRPRWARTRGSRWSAG